MRTRTMFTLAGALGVLLVLDAALAEARRGRRRRPARKIEHSARLASLQLPPAWTSNGLRQPPASASLAVTPGTGILVFPEGGILPSRLRNLKATKADEI